jgi:hypothetical protein
MFHPLLANPGKLKDADLDNKINELTKKYYIAARMGQGGVANQIAIALEMYRTEQYQRQIDMTQKVAKKQDRDLDDLINVN